MSFTVWIGINILVLVGMFFYLDGKINRKLQVRGLIDQARKELEGILVELNQVTERNVALVEDRIKQLKDSLEAVDRRLAVLNREVERRIPPSYSQQVQAKIQSPSRESGMEKKEVSRTEVLDLYNKGISPSLIAARLGTTIGEVELIISLQDRKEREA